MTRSAADLMQWDWESGLAEETNPPDEPIGRRWMKQWLHYADYVRLGSARGGPDRTRFETGWCDLTRRLRDLSNQWPTNGKS
jgi:hypothetical protein